MTGASVRWFANESARVAELLTVPGVAEHLSETERRILDRSARAVLARLAETAPPADLAGLAARESASR